MTSSKLFLLVLLCRGAVCAELIVVPPGDGDSLNLAPFGMINASTMRYQQVYDASQFSAITPGGAFIIALNFRINNASWPGANIPEVRIDLSTTSKLVDGLSTTFADNVGPNDTVVVGPGTVGMFQNHGPGLDPPFPIQINFTHPFFYNPAAGNLLLDVRLSQAVNGAFTPGAFVSSTAVGDATSRVYSLGVDSITGAADTFGLLTAFQVTPVPEPGSLSIVLLGLAIFSLALRRRIAPSERWGSVGAKRERPTLSTPR